MVQFVKPNLLGTRKEFANRFVNPITNGACADSTGQDVKVMKRRAHILHDMLDGCVQVRLAGCHMYLFCYEAPDSLGGHSGQFSLHLSHMGSRGFRMSMTTSTHSLRKVSCLL